MEMIEMADKGAMGAPYDYKTDLSLGECKDLCSNDNKCVTAMYQSSGYCFIYYHKPTLTTSTGYTVFLKVVIASSGMLKNIPHILLFV